MRTLDPLSTSRARETEQEWVACWSHRSVYRTLRSWPPNNIRGSNKRCQKLEVVIVIARVGRACVHACERCVARTRSRGVATPCSLATWPRVPGDSGRPYGSTFPTASVTATRRPGGRREQFFTSHHAPREHAFTPGADTGRTLGRRNHSNSLTHALTLSLSHSTPTQISRSQRQGRSQPRSKAAAVASWIHATMAGALVSLLGAPGSRCR